MTSNTILVTGGAGFIGSHTCKQLAGSGFHPVVIDNLSTGHEEAVKWGPLVKGDVRDIGLLNTTLVEYRPVAIMHFAANAYVGESVEKPAVYYNNNVAGLLTLLDAALQQNVGKIIFSSSCATYGVPPELPIVESCPQQPISPYGRSKLIGEQILKDYAAAYGLRHVILRYFNACGADPDGEIGERHDPETHVIPLALKAAAGTGPDFQLFGTDYATPDGTCIRDYVHVTDLAHAHVLALQHLLDGRSDLAVNIGSGAGHSVREILDEIHRTSGRTVPFVERQRRPGDPPSLFADISLSRESLGFEPRHSSLKTIIRTAAPFFGLETA